MSTSKKTPALTPARAHVLNIIKKATTPIVAYDILAKLAKILPNPKPPTVYRALSYLEEQGLIHRIDSLNAYTPCCADHKHQGAQFLICDKCGKVSEAHICTMPKELAAKTKALGFSPQRWNLEIHGYCASCAGI